MKKLIQVLSLIACIWTVGVASDFAWSAPATTAAPRRGGGTPAREIGASLKLAVLTASAVFNVGVVNPDTHSIELYIACEVDYDTAVATVSAEEPHYPDKLLAIFDNDARFAGDLESNTTPIRACPAII